MRRAPMGLVESWTPRQAFEKASRIAAMAHGHPSGTLRAGALSCLILLLLDGEQLRDAAGQTSGETKKREVIVSESFFGGSCMFETRPLYMAARSISYKLIYKEFLDPDDKLSPEGCELYNHSLDPLEQNNIYTPAHHAVPQLARHIYDRLREIPEVGSDRALRAYNQMTS